MKSRVTVFAVGIIALFSWWLLSTEQKKQIATTDDNHFIDAFINNFTLTSTDETGSPAYTLKADRLEHYNDQDTSQIIKPIINIPQQDNHWLITADFGEIDNKQSIIKLHDNVVMKQLVSDDIFELKTQAMTIDTQSQIIESDQTVKIWNGSLKLVSKGMHYNNASQQLKLLSDVDGIYVPQ